MNDSAAAAADDARREMKKSGAHTFFSAGEFLFFSPTFFFVYTLISIDFNEKLIRILLYVIDFVIVFRFQSSIY